jgi:hypothetical protein
MKFKNELCQDPENALIYSALDFFLDVFFRVDTSTSHTPMKLKKVMPGRGKRLDILRRFGSH